ncbi:hypothetical protein BDN71DRAFT_1510293 [Pleurotus eryngii]|uniref:Uncharacterized protein n=1 Tax=Pleurotus eryngii TaxID=5323 RepID=A0A9P6D561_PLEER|nr:hypothetical protein BDN71DRAFT_1510293 [Pleurotus eryngii]
MLSSFISYIPKGSKRKTKNLNHHDRVPTLAIGPSGSARGGEYSAYGAGAPWDYNGAYSQTYRSPILDIHDQRRTRDGQQRVSEEEFLQAPPPASPRLDLDIPSSHLQLSGLLPPELAKGDSIALLIDEELRNDARASGERPWVDDMDVAGRYEQRRSGKGYPAAHEQESAEDSPSASSASSDGVPIPPRQPFLEDEEDEDSIYSLEYVNFDPDAPPSAKRAKAEPTEGEEESILPYASVSRRPAPAPIKIPNLALYGPKVQLLPGSSGYQSRPQSRGNESIISTEPSSAVSGTSLARALFANTFVLSGNQTSRYRSGVSMNLTRQDSATLPRGEHPLMSSPFFRDRPEQIGSPILIPVGTGVSLPPPSSYRPSTAESMHRHRVPRRSVPDRPMTAPSSKHFSAASLPIKHASETDQSETETEPKENEIVSAPVDASSDQKLHRISRISEVASPPPSAPPSASTPGIASEHEENNAGSEAEASPSLPTDDKLGPEPQSSPSPSPSPSNPTHVQAASLPASDVPNIALPQLSQSQEVPIQTNDEPGVHLSALYSPNPTPRSAGEFSISSEPGSGREIDNVLDYYQFESQPTTFPNLRLPFSPISEESSSMLSPVSPANQRSANGSNSGVSLVGESKMSQQQNDARMSVLSSSAREWSPRKPSSPPLLPIGKRELPRRPGLLPIGDRPRSFQVSPPPPISLASPLSSSGSSKMSSLALSAGTTASSSLASPDSGGPLLPPSRSVFNRARSGSAPSPIKVVRNSRDFKKYHIAVVTPLSGGSEKEEHFEPARAEHDGRDGKTPDEPQDAMSSSGSQDFDRLRQEFPETPSAFSPTWSFTMMSPSGRGESTHEYPVLMPMSAGGGIGIRGSIQPASLAQQVLLTRAATSVRGARHSRQASLLRNATVPAAKVEMAPDGQRVMQPILQLEPPSAGRPLLLKRPLDEMEEETESVGSPVLPGTHHMVTEEPEAMEGQLPEDISPTIAKQSLPRIPLDVTQDELFSPRIPNAYPARLQKPRVGDPVLPTLFDLPLPSPQRSASASSPPVTPSFSFRGSPSPKPSAPASLASAAPSRSVSPLSVASSSRHPPSPKHPDWSSVHHPASPRLHLGSPHLSPAPSHVGFQDTSSLRSVSPAYPTSPTLYNHNSHSSPRFPSPSPVSSPTVPFMPPRSNSGASSSYESLHSVHRLPPVVRPPPLLLNTPGSSAHQYTVQYTPSPSVPKALPLSSPFISRQSRLDLDHPLSPSFVPPPPYSTVANSHDHSSGGDVSDQLSNLTHAPNSANSNIAAEVDPRTPLSSVPRRPRVRPPLPMGPRRPQQVVGHLSANSGDVRQRNASAPNIGNTGTTSGHQRQHPAQVPKFRPPVPKWRGYTLEAAKWTFSSAELQQIVSRAIRQSAEASSFRLLQLATLDNDISQEMERLKTQQAEIRTKYKLSSRRRRGLLDALTGHLEGSVVEYSAPTLRIVDELADTCLQLDELTEDLDSVDEQLSQLTSLCEVHSSSALAMALRKLNTSFLKQMQENKALKEQIETLQAERDEAWKQAQEVANDYDDLTGRIDSAVPDSAGCRSSKVMAVRKSSIRASKAGLRSTSSFRRSQRSSVSSNGQRNSVASVSALAVSPNEVPPVPPIPRRKPFDIVTDIPTRTSSTAYSNGVTPTSETRALVRAQEELYDMLGITLRETHTALRRSHSVSDRPPDFNISTLYPSGDSRQRYSDASSGGPGTRRSSMPNHTGLHQVYTAMTADRKAMLATLGMLSDQN